MPRASSRSSSSASRSSVIALSSALRAPEIAVDGRPDEPQLHRQRHQALLGPVVKVALQAAPLGVAGLDDARPRGGEHLARVGVGQRLGHQLGEVAQAPLGPLVEVAGVAGRRHQRAPHPAGHADGRGHRRAVAPCAQALRQLAADALVALDALHPAAATHAGEHGLAVQRDARADRKAVAVLGPAADDRGPPVFLVAHDPRARCAQQPPHLLGHLREQRSGRRLGWPPGWRSGAAPTAPRRACACPARWPPGAAPPPAAR